MKHTLKTTQKPTPSLRLLALFAALLLPAWIAPAAPTITPSSGSTPFAVSNSDLLQTDLGATPVVTGEFAEFSTGGEGVLRDGSDGGTPDANFATTSIVRTGSTVTYAFDVGLNPFGYTLTEINTFGAWDDGRDAQNINILYSTILDPTTFVPLATVGFDPFPGTFSRVSVTPGIGDPFLATDVHSIRFAFPTQENGGGGYRELDVLGFAAVPEPAITGCLLGMAALAFALARKKLRRNHVRNEFSKPLMDTD